MDMYERSVRGRQSRAQGKNFEDMIEDAAWYYENQGIAAIDKTPEAFKVIKPADRSKGQFLCCFTKQAQPDFKGALMDATMILFDAKHTDKERISRDVITAEQEDCFERYGKMGAFCFLVVSLNFTDFYRIPWVVFRDMKKLFGHKYMNKAELNPYRIAYSKGVLRFLDGIELRESEEEHESNEV
ncbi:MAG: Holliday junction resolvase RecU [Lachnospiraceae bacterium]|nr:Holliday junction resolvase RecU [Lachnospiraceae bacterium]